MQMLFVHACKSISTPVTRLLLFSSDFFSPPSNLTHINTPSHTLGTLSVLLLRGAGRVRGRLRLHGSVCAGGLMKESGKYELHF